MAAGKNSAHYAPESIVSVNLEIEFDVIIAINCIVLSAVVAQPLARSLRNLVHVLRVAGSNPPHSKNVLNSVVHSWLF